MDRTWSPNVEISPNCPRCASSNTKFCYYNNYSLTQPRYFCKGCRRYWTKGGSLRNVPIGGGCRKSRRGRPWRLPNDHAAVSSKSAPTESSLSRYPCAATRVSMSSSAEPIPIMADGSHIDLALVYANYLNPQAADNYGKPGIEIPEFLDGGNLHAATGGTILSGKKNDNVLYSDAGAGQNNGFQEYTETANGGDGYLLPPLPGEEIFWASNCQSLQEPRFGADLQEPNLSFASWSTLDF